MSSELIAEGQSIFDNMIDQGVLQHYGVPGMRWGIRKSRGGTPASTRKPVSDGTKKPSLPQVGSRVKNARTGEVSIVKDVKPGVHPKTGKPGALITVEAQTQARSKRPSELSDDDLKKAISRLQMEKQYRELSATPSATSPGKAMVKQMLRDSTKDAGKLLLTAAMVYAGKQAVEKTLGVDVKTDMFPKKK